MLYIVIVNDGEIIRECAIFDNFEMAADTFSAFLDFWGGANVCLAIKKINEIPANVYSAQMRANDSRSHRD